MKLGTNDGHLKKNYVKLTGKSSKYEFERNASLHQWVKKIPVTVFISKTK